MKLPASPRAGSRRTTSTTSTPTSRSGATRRTRARSTASGSSTSTIRAGRGELLDFEGCGNGANGGQGDVVVWGSILVRAWDVNAGARSDLRRPAVPRRLRGPARLRRQRPAEPGARRQRRPAVRLAHARPACRICGNRRLLVYGTPSPTARAACHGIDIVEVPLSRPEESEFLHFEFAGRNQAGRGAVPLP